MTRSIIRSLTRGSRYEFDDWEANGCTGWSYKGVLPFFMKSEDILKEELQSSKYHSSGGPLAVSKSRITVLSDMYMKAGEELDINSGSYMSANV